MTTGALVGAFLMLVPVGLFGIWLPVIRELGRPTRLASALFCGGVALACAAAVFRLAGLQPSPLLLVVPLAGLSLIAARLLSRIPESPGPENAYPPFSAAMIVAAFTVYLIAALATAAPPSTGTTPGATPPSAISLVTPGAYESDGAASLPPASRMLPVGWLLAALPLVAALLAMHVPLRRGWMIAAIWYAVMATAFSAWHSALGPGTLQIVLVTLGTLAVYGGAKEPRLLGFASIMLCGAALWGLDAVAAVAAIVTVGFARDLSEGAGRAAIRAALTLSGPAVAMAITLLSPSGAIPRSTAEDGVFAVTALISLSVLAAGLWHRGGSHHARPSHREAHAR